MTSNSFFTRSLNQGLSGALHLARGVPLFDPTVTGLATYRLHQVEDIFQQYAPRLRPLHPAVLAQDPGSVRAFDHLVAEALSAMRSGQPSGPRRALSAFDRFFYKNEEELLDDPTFPKAERLRIIESVDWLNVHLGSYQLWGTLAEEMISAAERRGAGPVRVHDLATGHGGFALALKARLGDRVQVTASDLADEYLDLGRQRAAQLGLEVRFVRQDATDLRAVEPADVFLCTQSIHHFPPGMVARMCGQAAQAARHGVCFIDAERGLLPLLLLSPVMAAYSRSYAMFHDTAASLRRMYFAEEMLLLSRLAPGMPEAARIEIDRRPPLFAYLRVTTAS